MPGYPLFISGFVQSTNPSLLKFKIANEHREFRNYLLLKKHAPKDRGNHTAYHGKCHNEIVQPFQSRYTGKNTKSYSDDKTGPRTLKPGEGTLDPALEEAAAALAEGQCSGILESDEGFSILRRLPTDTDSLKDTYFDSLLQNAAENAAVETADTYKKLETGSFYEKLRDMRETSRNP